MPFFENNFAKLHYYEYGSGEQIMLAFHGFGMRGTQFSVLEEAFGSQYKIYSFDIFFHGNTELKDCSLEVIRKGLQPTLLSTQIQAFLKSKGVEEEENFSLLSYSIGAKFAWSLIENMSQRVHNAYFIAPDGIEPNKLLTFGAGNKLINKIFHQLVYSPSTVKFILDNLYKFKYIDASLHRILDFEFGTVETRLICYNTITYFNSMRFERQKLAQVINECNINCHFYFGKKDKLFPPAIGLRFAKLLNKPNMHIFEEGHELVNNKLMQYLSLQLVSND